MHRQKRKVVLLVDNAPSHIYDKNALSNVQVKFLNPNMTSHIQPLDAGIIHSFKANYRRLYIFHVLDNDAMGKKDIYYINQLQGMRLAENAWEKITSQIVQNCWQHTGILFAASLPVGPNIAETERANSELQLALNRLVEEQYISLRNIASIEDLVQNEGEKVTEDEWTIEDFIKQQHLDV